MKEQCVDKNVGPAARCRSEEIRGVCVKVVKQRMAFCNFPLAAAERCERVNVDVGTTDDFSNLKVLQRNLDYRKKELFSFLTQQILARSVKKRRSYSRSKSSGFENNLSPSLHVRGKEPVRRHNRLDFPP